MNSRLLCLAICLAGAPHRVGAQSFPAFGPGLQNRSWNSSQLFREISEIILPTAPPGYSAGQPNGNNYVTMYKGYLFVPFASDDMKPQGGFQFWDVSDLLNPKAAFTRNDASTGTMVEPHGYGFVSLAGKDYACFQEQYGIAIWDFTDLGSLKPVSKLALPGIGQGGYNNGIFGVFWQHPYVYAAGSVQGVFVIDVADITKPRLVRQIPISAMGNFRVGNTFAIGNILLAATVRGGNNRGLAFFDIGNPANPVLLSTPTTAASKGFYSALINGGKIYLGGDEKEVDGSRSKLYVYELFDFPNLVLDLISPDLQGTGEYQFVQDDYVIFGMEEIWYKASLKNGNYKESGSGRFPETTYRGQQEGHPTPLGNVILLGDDHTRASGFFVHDVNPDKAPPMVNMVSPLNGSLNQPPTSRVGVSFSDQIDIQSVNAVTFVVRPQGGAPLKGYYSVQQSIANFTPEAPLQRNQQYEVIITGVKDFAGNAMTTPFQAAFSTGSTAFTPPGRVTLKGSRISLSAPSQPGNEAGKAHDMSFSTYWQSPASGTSFPVEIVIDLKESMTVDRLNYYPRKTNGANGFITRYEVHVGSTTNSWTKVAEGDWDGNLNSKYAEFTGTPGRYVKLSALQGTGGVASASQFSVEAGTATTVDLANPRQRPSRELQLNIPPFGNVAFPDVGRPIRFQLFDLEGKVILKWDAGRSSGNLRLPSGGLFLLQLVGEEGRSISKVTPR